MVPLHHWRTCLRIASQRLAYHAFRSLRLVAVHRSKLPFSSYEETSKCDPEVRKFDDKLRSRTRKIFSDIVEQQQHYRSLSFNSIKEATTCLLETDRDAINIIGEHISDVRKDPVLFKLVQDFLEACEVTKKFCDAALSSIQHARDNQRLVERILDLMPSGKELTKLEMEEILTLMQDFRCAGDPFSGDFINALAAIPERMERPVSKLKAEGHKLLNRERVWRKVTSLILATAVTGIAISSVLALAMSSPEQASASEFVTASESSDSPTETMARSWVESLWITHEKEITEKRISIVEMMEINSVVQIEEAKTIRTEVESLNDRLKSIANDMDFAQRRTTVEGALEIAVQDIKNRNKPFLDLLVELHNHIVSVQQQTDSAAIELLHALQELSFKKPFYRRCCGSCTMYCRSCNSSRAVEPKGNVKNLIA